MCWRSAFASDHVIREIYVAGDFKKPFIAFQLDPTDIPDDVLYFVSGFPRIPIASVNQQQLRSEIARLATQRIGWVDRRTIGGALAKQRFAVWPTDLDAGLTPDLGPLAKV